MTTMNKPRCGLYFLAYAGQLAEELRAYTLDATVAWCRACAQKCVAIKAEFAVVKYPQGCAPQVGPSAQYGRFCPVRVMPGWPKGMREWRDICGWTPRWYLPPMDAAGNLEHVLEMMRLAIREEDLLASDALLRVLDACYPGWRESGGIKIDGSGSDGRVLAQALGARLLDDGVPFWVEAWNSKRSPLAKRSTRWEPGVFFEESWDPTRKEWYQPDNNPAWADQASPSKVTVALGWRAEEPFPMDRALFNLRRGHDIIGGLPCTPDELRALAATPAITT